MGHLVEPSSAVFLDLQLVDPLALLRVRQPVPPREELQPEMGQDHSLIKFLGILEATTAFRKLQIETTNTLD
jgi:hypothetical protein